MASLDSALSGLSKPAEKSDKSKVRPGMKAVASKPKGNAGAMLASAATKLNPAMKKVK